MSLTYDDTGKAYWCGKRVARVTEICSLLAPRFPCDPWYLKRGSIGHLITQYHDQGELDENTVCPSLKTRFQAYLKFNKEVLPETILIEKPLYHPKYNYCGKPDRYGLLFRWKSVWDIKFGGPAEADSYQLSLYLFLLRVNGYPAEKAFDVYLKDNGNYQVKEVKHITEVFLKCLGGLKLWNSAQEEENMMKSVMKEEIAPSVS